MRNICIVDDVERMWANLRYCFSICLNGQTKTFLQYWETKVGFQAVLQWHILCPCTSYRLRPQVLYLTVWSRVHIEKLVVPQLDKKLPAHHTAWTVLSCSKQPTSCPCPEATRCHPVSFKFHSNPIKTKRRLLYLKTQSVPRSKHFSSRL
jgi:hypothetical protein